MQLVVAAIRHAGGDAVPQSVRSEDSLVLQLGFDSMKIALLSLSLEDAFGQTVLLDGWIASHPDPNDLTIGSLCHYIEEAVRRESAA